MKYKNKYLNTVINGSRGVEKLFIKADKALEQQQTEIEKLNIALDFSISRNKRLTASNEKLKAESKANLDGWKQARRIIDKMNMRLRK